MELLQSNQRKIQTIKSIEGNGRKKGKNRKRKQYRKNYFVIQCGNVKNKTVENWSVYVSTNNKNYSVNRAVASNTWISHMYIYTSTNVAWLKRNHIIMPFSYIMFFQF